MILADSSVWIDNFRTRNTALISLAKQKLLLMHPFVVGELAMGSLKDRELVLLDLGRMSRTRIATNREVLSMVEAQRLWSLGLGYIDAALLASVLLTRECRLWTRDRRLREVAARLEVAYAGPVR